MLKHEIKDTRNDEVLALPNIRLASGATGPEGFSDGCSSTLMYAKLDE
jgi:hypothetical protein